MTPLAVLLCLWGLSLAQNLCTPLATPVPGAERFTLIVDRPVDSLDCVAFRLSVSQALRTSLDNAVITRLASNPTRVSMECLDSTLCATRVPELLNAIRAGTVQFAYCTKNPTIFFSLFLSCSHKKLGVAMTKQMWYGARMQMEPYSATRHLRLRFHRGLLESSLEALL